MRKGTLQIMPNSSRGPNHFTYPLEMLLLGFIECFHFFVGGSVRFEFLGLVLDPVVEALDQARHVRLQHPHWLILEMEKQTKE
jgi:hypothetical protein